MTRSRDVPVRIYLRQTFRQFFRFKPRVYLDHNATTHVSRDVRRKMNRVVKHYYGNPSSLYRLARKSAEIMEQARQHVAEAIHADPQEIYFTGSATESNNAVLKAVSADCSSKKNKIISTPIEHPSVIKTLQHLETRGIVVEYCRIDRQGRVILAELERQVDEQTLLICCMAANNETGVIQDIHAITKIARQHGVLVLTDCVQALGKIPVDVRGWDVDYASFSAHKLYGPKGIGALYVKQGRPLSPILHGGHQENGMRAGTESLHNIVGFGAACQNVGNLLADAQRIRTLKSQLIHRLKQVKPDCGINSPETECLPNTISITFPGLENTDLMGMLDYCGIAVSAGSACTTGESEPSHVLKAVGLSDRAARETIRISLGQSNSAREIHYAARVFEDCIEGRIPQLVHRIDPAKLNESVLFDEQTYILDVRMPDDRRKFKGLPNSHELSPFYSIRKCLDQLPRDKHILVVCPGGGFSLMVAYYLKAKGFKHISDLRGGFHAWRTRRSDLYQKYAGQNITAIQP